jgi:preprotein translocase subunit SecB
MAKRANTATGPNSTYKNFLENVELYALGLNTISGNLKRAEYTDASQRPKELVHNIKSKFVLSEFDKDHFDVTAQLTLEGRRLTDETLLKIHVEYSAHFHTKSGTVQRKHAEQFADVEARLIFWPYFRQTISDLTARMHIRPLTIPLSL